MSTTGAAVGGRVAIAIEAVGPPTTGVPNTTGVNPGARAVTPGVRLIESVAPIVNVGEGLAGTVASRVGPWVGAAWVGGTAAAVAVPA